MEIFLFLTIIYFFTLIVGRELERIKVPWIFASLILGILFAFYHPIFSKTINSETFAFLARLGMFFFIFTIGFEIDIDEIRQKSLFMIKSATIIILIETIFGGLFIHFLFGTNWILAFYVAHFFATVGEAVLLPILDEFDLFNTELGQDIIGIGVVDDLFEVLSVLLLPFVISSARKTTHIDVSLAIGALIALFLLAYVFMKSLRNQALRFGESGLKEGSLFLFILLTIFLFSWIGEFAHAGILGGLLAGIASQNFIADSRIKQIETEVKAITYGLFGPIFFFWVGSDVKIVIPNGLSGFLGFSPLVIFLFLVLGKVVYVKAAKILGVVIAARKRYELKERLVMGIALSVKFSTSVVLIKALFEEGLIQAALYSTLISSKIVFKFLVPLILSYLIPKTDIKREEGNNK